MSKKTYTQKFEVGGSLLEKPTVITIDHFYDVDFNSLRYSYKVKFPYMRGFSMSGGYDTDGGILFPTFESASKQISDILQQIGYLSDCREFKMQLLGV